jgi:hypothetical protein
VFVRNEGAVEFVDVEWERFVDVASDARVGVAVIEGWLLSVAGCGSDVGVSVEDLAAGTELLVLLDGFIGVEVVLGFSFLVDDGLFTFDLGIVCSDEVLGVEVEVRIVLLADPSLSRPQSMTRYTINRTDIRCLQ